MTILQELAGLARGLTSGYYPPFVTGRDLGSEIPIFYYHRVDALEFEHHLRYLRQHGYKTITALDHCRSVAGSRTAPERSVVLTFDDGLSNLYEVVFPLLEKYKLNAVAFVIPARFGSHGVITWPQARQMYESGIVDIQSHSMHHIAIPVSEKIIGFHHPNHPVSEPWDLPVGGEWTSGIPEIFPEFGTPVFEHRSRISDARRYFSDPNLVQSCVAKVTELAGSEFFRRPGWQRVLLKRARDFANDGNRIGRYETAQEQVEAISRELIDSKTCIEGEIRGARVVHFAYPWSEVGQIARSLLRDCGYVSAYGGLSHRKVPPINDDDVFELGRLSGDFLPCLPSSERKSFFNVLWHKASRRLK